jgi:hypothetical protein
MRACLDEVHDLVPVALDILPPPDKRRVCERVETDVQLVCA